MEYAVYVGKGRTPQEAFESIWGPLSGSDGYCLRKEDGEWRMTLLVSTPTQEQRVLFEKEQ
jgi:hypothetical protein